MRATVGGRYHTGILKDITLSGGPNVSLPRDLCGV